MKALRFLLLPLPFLAVMCEAKPAKPAFNLDLRVERALEVQPCSAGEAQPAESALSTALPCVETTLGLEHLFAPHTLRFLYYDPDGNLYAATRADWILKPDAGTTGYHRKALVRHRLAVAGEEAALKPGSWKVAAWLDGLTISEAVFRLERPVPHAEGLENVGRVYRELRFEEVEPLAERALATEQAPAPRAEYLAWEALAWQALGKEPETQAALEKLLQEDPFFAWSPAQIEELGAKDAARHLELLRGRLRPEIYRKQVAPLTAELTPQEAPPAYSKRHWYRQWYFYAGVAALAVPAVLLAKGGGETVQEAGAPRLSLQITGKSTEFSSILCDGTLSVLPRLQGGHPPYQLLLTLSVAGSKSNVQVAGLPAKLGQESVALLKLPNINPGASAAFQLPKVEVVPVNNTNSALLRFGAVVLDSQSASSFTDIPINSALSPQKLAAWQQDPHASLQTLEQATQHCY